MVTQDVAPAMTRGEQLRILRECKLPKLRNVSSATLKIILRAIDDYAGLDRSCYASSDTIAKETGLCSRTVKRGMAALADHSYLQANKRPGQTTDCRINWDILNRGHSVTGDIVSPVTLSPGTGDMVSRTGDMVSRTGDMVSPDPIRSANEAPQKRKAKRKRTAEGGLLFADVDQELAEWFRDLVHSHTPEQKFDLEKWANQFRLMRKAGLSDERIRTVGAWGVSDNFWRSHILTPEKLRQHFARLASLSRTQPNKANRIGAGQSYDPRAKATYGQGFDDGGAA